jgi:hypothetical protein
MTLAALTDWLLIGLYVFCTAYGASAVRAFVGQEYAFAFNIMAIP